MASAVRSWKNALLRAAALFFVDALFFNQGAISVLVGLGLVAIGLPLALRRKNLPQRKERLRNLGIYGAAVVLVLAWNFLNNRLARSRADTVIAAVEAFHARYGRYPRSLQELVPGQLAAVPLAKYTLLFNRFVYLPDERTPGLFYVDLPPFGRPTYSFASRKWGYLD